MMKEKQTLPLISVVVPVYNVEGYIDKCIKSIIIQTYEKLEIILVDDGSTDSSGRICDEYAKMDDRIKVLHKENGGLVSARKAGILAATGEYATYVDGDDWIEKDIYEYLFAQIGDADVIVSGVVRDYEGENLSVCEKNKIPSGTYQGQELQKIYGNMIYTGKFFERGIQPHIFNVLYKKKILLDNQLQVPNEVRVGEDAACIYPVLLNANKITLINEAFYHYVMRADSIMGTRDPKELQRYQLLYKYLINRFSEVSENQERLIWQLDYFMLYCLLLKAVDVLQFEEDTVFPYTDLPHGSRVIVYGKGRFGKEFVDYINVNNVLSVVLWIDSGDEEKLREYIAAEEFDYIIIAVLIEEIAKKIEHNILNFGIESNRIKRISTDQIEKGKERVNTLLRSNVNE